MSLSSTDPADWAPPRCPHGHIILACPRDDCPEQNAYLDETLKQVNLYEERGRQAARQWARAALGLPAEH